MVFYLEEYDKSNTTIVPLLLVAQWRTSRVGRPQPVPTEGCYRGTVHRVEGKHHETD